MYLAFFGLADKPFAITPDPRYLYLGAQHADALAHLVYGINDAGGFIQLTGEVGTGKTTTIRSLLVRAPAQAEIALIVNPRLSPRDFLQTICEELGVALADGANASVKLLVDRLNDYLLQAHAAGRRVVLIVDEAQNLDIEVLAQLRRAAGEVFGRRVAPAWLLPVAGSLLLVAALGASAALLRLRPWAALPAAVPVAAKVGTAAAALPALPGLEEVLKGAGEEVTAERGLAGLLKLWGGSEVPGATDGCTQAHAQGLECVGLRSSLAQLRDLRRPAVLLLEGSDGPPYPRLLTGSGPPSVP